jgi:hypothetical protein
MPVPDPVTGWAAPAPEDAVPPLGPAPSVEPAPPVGPPPLPMYPYAPAPAAPRRRYGLVIGLVVGGVVLVLLLCVALVPLALKGSSTTTHGAAVASPSPTAHRVSATEYASELASLDQNLTNLMSPLAGARSPDAVTAAAETVGLEFSAASETLRNLVPPGSADSANHDLAASLSNLATRATEIGASAGTNTLCAGSSALATLSTSVEADQVRSAAKELLSADPTYVFGKFLPAATQGTNRRLNNGQQLKKASGGSGQLTAENHGGKDAVVTLATSGASSATAVFYVQAGQKATIKGIPDGSYVVYIRSGTDWDGTLGEFTVDCKTSEDPSAMAFKTTRSTYSVWTVKFGLSASDGGQDELQPVDPTSVPA